MATYDPQKTDIIFDGFQLSGYSDSEIELAFNSEDAINVNVGIKGEASTTEIADKTGTLKVGLKSSSIASNAYLEAKQKIKAEGSLMFVDRSSGTPMRMASDGVRIKNNPTRTRGTEESEVEWIFYIPRMNPVTIS